MINKLYKTIHNKYSIYFRFIFFLRYLFGLFALAIILFLLIPTFFNYEQRIGVFKDYLIKNYDFKILKYEKTHVFLRKKDSKQKKIEKKIVNKKKINKNEKIKK